MNDTLHRYHKKSVKKKKKKQLCKSLPTKTNEFTSTYHNILKLKWQEQSPLIVKLITLTTMDDHGPLSSVLNIHLFIPLFSFSNVIISEFNQIVE